MLSYQVLRDGDPGPLFRFEDGCLLTPDQFVSYVCSPLAEHGIDYSLYAGHSFRVGAATTAASHGLQDSLSRPLNIGKVWPMLCTY